MCLFRPAVSEETFEAKRQEPRGTCGPDPDENTGASGLKGGSIKMFANDQLCLHCGACVGSCPTNSIFLHETAFVEFLSTCIECELCVTICPVGAIRVISKSPSRAGYKLVQEANA